MGEWGGASANLGVRAGAASCAGSVWGLAGEWKVSVLPINVPLGPVRRREAKLM